MFYCPRLKLRSPVLSIDSRGSGDGNAAYRNLLEALAGG